MCREEIFRDEKIHVIDGYTVCPDCFIDYCRHYFKRCEVAAEDLFKYTEDFDEDD